MRLISSIAFLTFSLVSTHARAQMVTPADAAAPPAAPAATVNEVPAAPAVVETAAAPAAEGDKLVAILDLVAADKEAAPLANALAAVIASEVATRPGLKAVSRNELKAIVSQKAEAAMLGCDTPACAADIAKLVEAQLVVTGGLERITGTAAGPSGVAHVITVSLIEPTAPAVVGRAEATWRGNPEEMVTLVRPLLDRLFGGAAAADFRGSLELMAEDGTTVIVDGESRGTTPLKGPIEALPIGVHTVELVREGYLPERRDVVVSRNEKTIVSVQLIEQPLTDRWWFWPVVGGSAALVAGSVAAVAIALSAPVPPTTIVVKTPLPSTAAQE